ncbi:bifunctional acetate--CoA ligase family protein/GNAT family N-acetyltransferase [Cellvibrio japonicus]|uniref:Acetyltransferase, GNAT family n=1 Tax=Cellvibrio japonicus (strain Ueda107) TaxID=498211 RepID=B3PB71_CELJU|nr:bifunctional acetate--CoA ligase family protein/GNAT family N-acetyltransferase [Cellvibrio japonicus]ACE84415.1 acetyltransferase, GNAT family [Cellvibrio japonicus Ueda107]QEI11661.1 bifunctional acetate--CoA ligase family protein/GNAT family N-acetyltransferase [Cellvibrio japonicus]QEI15235.1 bifunctional acetate--CoA ligase family protein/GNAT family N-acetyltransferase [Cellvibrio japonicus]QEI18815.1 bifunctional acetate--CoA ligase family protein/GNAT family N-acetyltransferase [Cell
MSLKHIEHLLKPGSIAVIGASNQPNRPGNAVMRNLLQGGFDGPIMPVTPHYKSVNGVLAYRSIDELPLVPDLAVICTRATRVPAIILQLGRKGTRAAIVIAAGLNRLHTAQGTNLQEQMLAIARQWGVRILGPNSLGLMVPGIGLDASYAHTRARAGKIAFVSQSSAVCVTLLDWAKRRRIGFSHVVALGDGTDVDFDEMLDYLGRDANTSAILLYIDHIHQGRAFMSAARAASFNKPILVIKTGAQLENQMLISHLPMEQLGLDAVYDAAIKRAGMLRVGDLRELLAAVETLANGKPIQGEQLVILANGNAPSAMALDVLSQRGGRLAVLEPGIVDALHAVIHNGGRATNPINLLGDASPEDYRQALQVLLRSNAIDNLLIMHAPSALIPGETYAQVVIDTLREHRQKNGARLPNVLVNWMGEDAAVEARQRFADAGIASFRTPEGVVGAFMHMVQYRRNQKLLSETPESISDWAPHQPEVAQTLIDQALQERRHLLATNEAGQLLEAYGISTQPIQAAPELAPVPLRIQVQQDPVFGPVILLGEVASHWSVAKNAVVALPPLNMALARYLVIQALAEGKIRERDHYAPIHLPSLCVLLTRISQMIIDNPRLRGLCINPVLAHGEDIRALDTMIELVVDEPLPVLAIRPYPKELEESFRLHDGQQLLLRPIRPEDELRLQAFDNAQSREDRYKRYFGEMPPFSHEQMARLTQIDYAREMAFIAVDSLGDILGVVRAQADPDNIEAEFAMAIRSDLKGRGLGARLLQKMIDYCRVQGTQHLRGFTMLDNAGMVNLARKLGFRVSINRDDEVIDMRLELQAHMASSL